MKHWRYDDQLKSKHDTTSVERQLIFTSSILVEVHIELIHVQGFRGFSGFLVSKNCTVICWDCNGGGIVRWNGNRFRFHGGNSVTSMPGESHVVCVPISSQNSWSFSMHNYNITTNPLVNTAFVCILVFELNTTLYKCCKNTGENMRENRYIRYTDTTAWCHTVLWTWGPCTSDILGKQRGTAIGITLIVHNLSKCHVDCENSEYWLVIFFLNTHQWTWYRFLLSHMNGHNVLHSPFNFNVIFLFHFWSVSHFAPLTEITQFYIECWLILHEWHLYVFIFLTLTLYHSEKQSVVSRNGVLMTGECYNFLVTKTRYIIFGSFRQFTRNDTRN